MSAEVLLDAISEISGAPTQFATLPGGTKAIELPDQGIDSAFLDAFGRPKRNTACECERVGDASLSQSLMLLNSADVQTKLSSAGARAEIAPPTSPRSPRWPPRAAGPGWRVVRRSAAGARPCARLR